MPHLLSRVTLIDDDCISLMLLRKFLADHQVAETISAFTSGIEALNHFKKNAKAPSELPEVILLDVRMPDISGWQFLAELNKIEFREDYEPAVCIVTADTSINDESLNERWPCVKGCLLKPIILKKFIAVIESVATRIELNNVIDYTLAPVSLTA